MSFLKNIFKNIMNPKKPTRSGDLRYLDPEWRKKHYRDNYLSVRITRQPSTRLLTIMRDNRERYQAVADEFNTAHPGIRLYWLDIASIHALERECDFSTCLHNGESLASVNVHGTRLVPVGRGKGKNWNWHEAAMDALELKLKEGKVFPKSMAIEEHLFFLEQFNGTGYLRFHPNVLSPYLWSFTDKYRSGKYVGDGDWSDHAISQQCGVVVYWISLDQFALV